VGCLLGSIPTQRLDAFLDSQAWLIFPLQMPKETLFLMSLEKAKTNIYQRLKIAKEIRNTVI
jgi:hypothetical protein